MLARAFPVIPALAFGLALSLPVRAAEPPRAATPAPLAQVSTKPACTCRAAGQSFDVGSEICLGNRMMRCTMAINVTSWEKTDLPCPQS